MGYLFNISSRFYRRAVDQALEKYDLTTSQCAVIRMLFHQGEMTQTKISNQFSSDRATIGSVIMKLSKNLSMADDFMAGPWPILFTSKENLFAIRSLTSNGVLETGAMTREESWARASRNCIGGIVKWQIGFKNAKSNLVEEVCF